MQKCLTCFISIVWVHFSHKTQKFLFWKLLKYFNFVDKKKWCQFRICPMKQCLIWLKLCCVSKILAISWEIRILNFIEIISCFSIKEYVIRSKFVPAFCLICFFCCYYRNSLYIWLYIYTLLHVKYRQKKQQQKQQHTQTKLHDRQMPIYRKVSGSTK